MFKLKRVYEKPSPEDGFRVLVERLWPRGVSKERAGLDLWLKDVAPSPELRKWFSHDPAKWKEFQERYAAGGGPDGRLARIGGPVARGQHPLHDGSGVGPPDVLHVRRRPHG